MSVGVAISLAETEPWTAAQSAWPEGRRPVTCEGHCLTAVGGRAVSFTLLVAVAFLRLPEVVRTEVQPWLPCSWSWPWQQQQAAGSTGRLQVVQSRL
ncbi:UNVERIFIED_CONTAM: hypothetical protein Sangu_2208800 [Sesamum angustifolium]|uniref:Uncharacterized protein n=1 Tax=Sesamum angustifolium TaxID=2727405 RepID=A0AAW2LFK5_9LAMI